MTTQTITEVIHIVEWFYQTETISCKRRFSENVRARDAVIHLCHRYEIAKDKEVAECLNMDRSSVVAGRKRIANRIEPVRGRILDKQFFEDLQTLETYIYGILA